MTDKTTAERWYMLNKDGMATLCADKPDAEQEAKKADAAYPNGAPHRAVLMGEVAPPATAQAISAEPAGAGYAELPDAKTLGEAVAAWIGVETRGAHKRVDTTVDRLGFAVRSVMGDMLRASHGQAPAQPSDPHAELRKAWTPPSTQTASKEQTMTDKPTPTPTDAELKAMWQLHAADIGGIFYYARAVLAKWGQPAQAAEPVAREPLTPERLREIERMCVYANTATLIDFARAIERAHGIKGGQHAE